MNFSKRIFSNDYIKKLDELNIDIEEFNLKGLINQLDNWMIKNKYIIEKSYDFSICRPQFLRPTVICPPVVLVG